MLEIELVKTTMRPFWVKRAGLSMECLRRNFAREIRDCTLHICPQEVASSVATLVLHEATTDSGTNSMVSDPGAEREALAGALQTPRRYRPRLMLDSYHR